MLVGPSDHIGWRTRFWRWVMKHVYPLKQNDRAPWTPLTKPIGECRVALVTSCGVYPKTSPPFDTGNVAGDTSFREISSDARPEDLAIAHKHYDHTSAERDLNVVFPLWRLHALAQEGHIGSVAPRHFGFMGAISSPGPLVRTSAPAVAEMLKQDAVDIVLLTPC